MEFLIGAVVGAFIGWIVPRPAWADRLIKKISVK